jgi:uncharacterized damage-inducible protein DinB
MMYRKIDDFSAAYTRKSEENHKLMQQLTDASLNQRVAEGHRTLGQIAWHLAMSIPEMTSRMGITMEGLDHEAPPPANAKAIAEAYHKASQELLKRVKTDWNDATLEVVDDMYGEQWARGLTLSILIDHESHHAGQMSVLMRQAGVKPTALCGPTKEDWAQYGMEAPAY